MSPAARLPTPACLCRARASSPAHRDSDPPPRTHLCVPALNSSPATPYFGACPIDFTAVTPGLAAPHKKVVETHASQARAILSNLKNTIAEDSDDKAARERKRCASIVKTIKKVKGERVKNQAYESKKFQDCIAWLNVQEKDIGELQEK
eukprot:COSAG06_NODE_17963_length_911_cov_4.314039_1_plen_148_part_01